MLHIPTVCPKPNHKQQLISNTDGAHGKCGGHTWHGAQHGAQHGVAAYIGTMPLLKVQKLLRSRTMLGMLQGTPPAHNPACSATAVLLGVMPYVPMAAADHARSLSATHRPASLPCVPSVAHANAHAHTHACMSSGRRHTRAGRAAVKTARDAFPGEAARDGRVLAGSGVEVVIRDRAAGRVEQAAGVSVWQEHDPAGRRADEVHAHEVVLTWLVPCTPAFGNHC